MTAQTIPEALRMAADHIETVGWFQGDFFARVSPDHTKCPACALGGISVAVLGKDGWAGTAKWPTPEYEEKRRIHHETTMALWTYLGMDDDGSIPEWNDDPERTAEEVIAALRGAADQVESRE